MELLYFRLGDTTDQLASPEFSFAGGLCGWYFLVVLPSLSGKIPISAVIDKGQFW